MAGAGKDGREPNCIETQGADVCQFFDHTAQRASKRACQVFLLQPVPALPRAETVHKYLVDARGLTPLWHAVLSVPNRKLVSCSSVPGLVIRKEPKLCCLAAFFCRVCLAFGQACVDLVAQERPRGLGWKLRVPFGYPSPRKRIPALPDRRKGFLRVIAPIAHEITQHQFLYRLVAGSGRVKGNLVSRSGNQRCFPPEMVHAEGAINHKSRPDSRGVQVTKAVVAQIVWNNLGHTAHRSTYKFLVAQIQSYQIPT